MNKNYSFLTPIGAMDVSFYFYGYEPIFIDKNQFTNCSVLIFCTTHITKQRKVIPIDSTYLAQVQHKQC